MAENFRPIEGFDGKYEVSDMGTVVNKVTDRIITHTVRQDGRVVVALNGKQYLLHRLVYTAFGEGDTNVQVAHIDGDSTNNRIENLAPRSEVTQLNQNKDRKIKLTYKQIQEARLAADDIAHSLNQVLEAYERHWRANQEEVPLTIKAETHKNIIKLPPLSRVIQKIKNELKDEM